MSRTARKLALASAASAIAASALAAPAGAVQTTTLTYQCKYPLIGVKALSVKIDLDIPDTWPAGQPTNPFGVTATASAFDMADGLQAVDDLTAIQGSSTAFATVKTAQGFDVPAKTVATIAKTVLPDPVPNPLVLTATGSTPALTFDEPGTEKIVLDRLAINLTALDSAGDPIVLPPVTKDIDGNKVSDSDGDPNTFDVYCKLDAGQDTTLGSFDIIGDDEPTPTPPVGTPTPTATPPVTTPTPTPTATPPVGTPTPTPPVGTCTGSTAKYSYSLQGSTTINTLTKGSMPLTGAIDAVLCLATGNYTATTVINDTQGRLTALGFLPVTVGVGIIPSGPTTGQLIDDQITANLKARIKIKSAKAFGAIPLVSGNNCQSKELSTIALKSTDSFDPTVTGGNIAGTYAISNLNGCGILEGLVSPLTAGGGNTITAKLTPKASS
ncbi:MAG: hypothetical protein J7513_06835 [Solirubrobacteraceae bacterium]|nr:hypothetical protein [Solirubrobacteraceae bacterium]